MKKEKILDVLFNKNAKKEEFDFSPKNYTMKEMYDAEKLIVGKLEYISSDVTPGGPMVKKSSQNYIFEPIIIDGKIKYQEVFTGFIAANSENGYFDLPYVVDMKRLTEVSTNYEQTKIPKLGMLLALNAVNLEPIKCDNNALCRKNQNR